MEFEEWEHQGKWHFYLGRQPWVQSSLKITSRKEGFSLQLVVSRFATWTRRSTTSPLRRHKEPVDCGMLCFLHLLGDAKVSFSEMLKVWRGVKARRE